MGEHLDSGTQTVSVHRDYAHKFQFKHKIKTEDFTIIAEAIREGTAIGDRHLHITIFYVDKREEPRCWQVTIKANKRRTDIYISTFHRLTSADIARKMKRGILIPRK